MAKLMEQKINKRGKRPVLSKAMLDAGYAPNTAKNPQQVKKSMGWKQLQDLHFPESRVTEKIAQLLDAAKIDHYVFSPKDSDELVTQIVESIPGCKVKKIVHGEQSKRVYYWIPDNRTQSDMVDTILKIQGRYAAQKVTIEDPNENLTDEQLDAKIKQLEKANKSRYDQAMADKKKKK